MGDGILTPKKSASDDSDEALLARIAGGESAALCAFYDRHSSLIYALLLRILNRAEDAEDALQLTFLQVWRSAQQYDAQRGSIRNWLILIARSRGRDVLRRQRKLGKAVSLSEADTQDPSTVLDKLNQDSRLHRALKEIPTEQSSAIALAFYGGMTYEEVAEKENLPVGTVKTRIRTGLQRLRNLLKTGK
jgi:RNA polymerase sigma-70 factor, ECF subfamily